ncbi:NitT/TauT family transport system permease protein [Natronocella acetinitrilica]|uniref:NitT/TauT family transport system permease protein n=1 Tax=Natronocella acetinitrilica TaxID=414046 RepID=A0AAE3G799_9GAMM|nr:ABC transporter permease [Natronocella acetinitrilica]MCP1676742.1 NitT/TauT family transport system permease protein [Natronocella acetinitrilica]
MSKMRMLYPLVTLVIILAAWDITTRFGYVEAFLLPTPEAVWWAIYRGFATGSFWPHISFTLQSTIIGYIIGSLAAVLIGALIVESDIAERMLYPYIIALQSMPKVSLAPLILVWFGFGLTSKVVLVGLICFFPVLVNTIVGMRRTDPDLLEMCRSFSLSRSYVFFHVKLPSAASSIFAGLQIGIVLALIGAVVGEFIASQRGVGHMISAATMNMNLSTMFAGIFLLSVFGIVGSFFVRLLHRKVVFWEKSAGGLSEGTA